MSSILADDKKFVPYPALIFVVSLLFVGIGLTINGYVTGDPGEYTILGASVASIGTVGLMGSVVSLSSEVRENLLAVSLASLFITALSVTHFEGSIVGVIIERLISVSLLAVIALSVLVFIASFENWFTNEKTPEERILEE